MRDFAKPSALESEIHPSHKSEIYALCISRLHRAYGPGNGNRFVTGSLSCHSQNRRRRRGLSQEIFILDRQSWVMFEEESTISVIPSDRSICTLYIQMFQIIVGNFVYDGLKRPTARKNWTTLPETVTDGCTIRQMCFISPAGYFVLPSVMPDTAERTGAISVINTFHRQSLWKGWPLNQCIP